MALIRAQAEIQSAAGMPSDVIMNRFHFRTPTTPATSAEEDEIFIRVSTFYDGVLISGRRLSARYPVTVAQNGHTINLYDMADPEPRVPIHTGVFNFAVAPNQAGYPDEVALVLSFQAVPVSGTPQARRRNRIYFGPLHSTNGQSTGSETRPATLLITDLLDAANEKLGTATAGVEWMVRSETTGAVAPVANGWVDNSFDTQRRRGPAPTTRTTFVV